MSEYMISYHNIIDCITDAQASCSRSLRAQACIRVAAAVRVSCRALRRAPYGSSFMKTRVLLCHDILHDMCVYIYIYIYIHIS